MKRIMYLALITSISLFLASCGDNNLPNTILNESDLLEETKVADSSQNKNSENIVEEIEEVVEELIDSFTFSTAGVIEKTILYDSNGIRITADELKYNNYSVELSLELENNTDKNVSVKSNITAYSCNAINGYMIEDGYMNVDLKAGKKASETIDFSTDGLLLYGITEIADIELGLVIVDDDYNYTYLEPCKMNTNLAQNHDYYEDYYGKAINSSNATKTYGYSVDLYSTDCQYEQNGVKLLSECILTNRSGEKILILEFENNSSSIVNECIGNISLDGLTVYSGLWTSDTILPDHKAFATISLKSLFDKEASELFDITEIDSIGMNISLMNAQGETITDECTYCVSINSNSTGYSVSDNVIYSGNDIHVSYQGLYEEDSYSPDIHIILVASNTGSEEVYIDDEYDSFSVNDYMSTCYFSSTSIKPGAIVMVDLEIPEFYFEDLLKCTTMA